jgi:arylsulfatase A-like enzyme
LVMIFDGRWKYVHIETMHPLLYDLKTDPGELMNLGNDSKHASQIARLSTLHFEWARRHHSRITLGSATINAMAANKEPPGILIGYWDQKELEADGKKIPAHLRNG